MSKDKSHKYFGVGLSDITKREGSVIPNIIYKLTNYLLKNGLEQEGIFRINGSTKTVEKLMNQFDKKGDADLSNIFEPSAIASLLKQYLRDLPDTLIPASMTQSFVATQEGYTKDNKMLMNLRHLVSLLPVENFRTLKYLVAFLVLASKQHSSSKMNAAALSTVFGPNIFKCAPGFPGLKEQGVNNCIILQFINKYQQIFTLHEDELTPNDENFTLDGLKESLKEENEMTKEVKHSIASLRKVTTNDVKKKVTAGDDRDAKKDSLDKNVASSEDVMEDRHAQLTNSPTPLLANNKRRGSLESDTVTLSEIVLSEIDKAIMKYVFCAHESFSDNEEKVSVLGNKMNALKLHTSTNVNNSSAPTKHNAKSSLHILPNSDNDEEDDDNCDDDDDSTIDFSDDDDDDDDEEDGHDECSTNKTIIKCPPAIKSSLAKGIFHQKELVTSNRRDEGRQVLEPVYFSKVDNEDNGGDISFHSDPDSSLQMVKVKRKMKAIVQKLRVLEEEFEKDFGRKVTTTDLHGHPQIKNLRKELMGFKNQLEDYDKNNIGDHHHQPQQATSVKETFDSLMENLHVRRISAGRPEDPKLMSSQQLNEEKTSLQKALLKFEQMHGRPNTSTTKGIMMPLYDRYRIVKRILSQNKKQQQSRPSSGEHHHHNHPSRPNSTGSRNDKEDNLNQMTFSQLTSELEKTQQQKKNLQLELQRFEQKFQLENGRRVQKADQMVKAAEYRQYVNIKSRLKLLEVLLSKSQKQSSQDAS